eukprot:10949908-Heterocapsa_arctica.AAC.1
MATVLAEWNHVVQYCILVPSTSTTNVASAGRSTCPPMGTSCSRYLELKFSFSVLVAYARTYHNKTADFYTRCSDEEFPELARRQGFE